MSILKNIDLTKHISEFKEKGYTVFKEIHSQEEVLEWNDKYAQLRQALYGDDIHSRYIFDNMLEREPKMMMRVMANPLILDFLELIMGPFLQIGDSVIVGFNPKEKEEAQHKVNGWHRDRYSYIPNGDSYQIPRAVTALSYLHELTEEYGYFRVIPGSHCKGIVLQKQDFQVTHPDEEVVPISAGDKIIFSNTLLHSGSPNTSGMHRVFIGGSYLPTWYKTMDNFNGPNVLQMIKAAKEQNDLRKMRLFGIDEQMHDRTNAAAKIQDDYRDGALWQEWIAKDKSAFKS